MSNDEVKDRRNFGYYRVDNEVIDNFGARIGVLGIAIYNFLAKSADWNDNTCWPSYNTIALKLGISKGTAIKGIQLLVDAGLILHERRDAVKKGHVSNIYTLLPVEKNIPTKAQASDNLVQNLDKGVAKSRKDLSDPCANSEQGGQIIEQGLVQNTDKACANSAPKQDPENTTQLNKTQNNEKNKRPLDSPAAAASPVHVVFEYWQTKTGHTQAKLTPERDRIIRLRLKDYTPDELMRAIDGCLVSPFHMGQNDRHTVYDGLKTILRDGEQVEKFIAMSEANGNGKSQSPAMKSKPELSSDEIDELARTVKQMLADGRKFNEVEAQLSPSVRPYDWRKVRSIVGVPNEPVPVPATAAIAQNIAANMQMPSKPG